MAKRGLLTIQMDSKGNEIYTTARDNGKGEAVTDVELKGLSQDGVIRNDSIATFAGKIKGDTTIPHLAKFIQTATKPTTKNFGTNEFNQSYIDTLSVLGSTQIAGFTGVNNFYAEFSFDLLYQRRKTENNPSLVIADLKAKTSELVITYNGTFQGEKNGIPAYGSVISVWNNRTNAWDVIEDNDKPYTMLVYSIRANVADYIDSTGKVNIRAHSKNNSTAAVSGLATFEYIDLNSRYDVEVTSVAEITQKGLKTTDELVLNKVQDLEDKIDLVLNAKATIKTKSVEDYAINIQHLEEFKKEAAIQAKRTIVPVSMVGDSITEGGVTTDFTVNGYTS